MGERWGGVPSAARLVKRTARYFTSYDVGDAPVATSPKPTVRVQGLELNTVVMAQLFVARPGVGWPFSVQLLRA